MVVFLCTESNQYTTLIYVDDLKVSWKDPRDVDDTKGVVQLFMARVQAPDRDDQQGSLTIWWVLDSWSGRWFINLVPFMDHLMRFMKMFNNVARRSFYYV